MVTIVGVRVEEERSRWRGKTETERTLEGRMSVGRVRVVGSEGPERGVRLGAWEGARRGG